MSDILKKQGYVSVNELCEEMGLRIIDIVRVINKYNITAVRITNQIYIQEKDVERILTLEMASQNERRQQRRARSSVSASEKRLRLQLLQNYSIESIISVLNQPEFRGALEEANTNTPPQSPSPPPAPNATPKVSPETSETEGNETGE